MKSFLAGLGIGIGVGILFAPESGEVNRRKLQFRLTEWLESFGRIIDETKGRLQSETGQTATKDQAVRKKDQASAEVLSDAVNSINSMSHDELMNVNGIGPVLAEKIISNRPYSSRRELLDRGILPQSTFEELERELEERRLRSA